MTDTTIAGEKPALGVGSIIGETFSILFSNLVPVIIIGFVPSVLAVLVGALAMGTTDPFGGDLDPTQVSGVGMLGSNLVHIVMMAVTTALVVQLAYDSKLGRPVRLGRYVGPALRSIVPIVVLTVIVTILATIGMALLIVPGLWVFAVFLVVTPAIVIDRAGFGAMGRSARLTKEYRWPIVGALVLLFIIFFLLAIAAGAIAFWAAGMGGFFVFAVVQGLINAVVYGLGSILVALVYARLREIKEGVTVDQIAAVFD